MTKCDLFKSISENVWNSICRNHNRNNRLSEEGVSRNTVISDIQNYVEDHNTFNVFAQKSLNEVSSGGDIEIYIDNGHKEFYRILLQAKIVELNGCFEHLNRYSGSTGRRQYDTLRSFANQTGSDAYYLMYNGCPGYTTKGSDCAGTYDEKQFGCALLTANEIKRHCEGTSSGTLGNSRTCMPQGIPWRILTCCDYNYKSGSKLYAPDEIDMDPYFKNLFLASDRISFITQEQMINNERIIRQNETLHRNGWKPSARIVVSKDGMYKGRDGLLEI